MPHPNLLMHYSFNHDSVYTDSVYKIYLKINIHFALIISNSLYNILNQSKSYNIILIFKTNILSTKTLLMKKYHIYNSSSK